MSRIGKMPIQIPQGVTVTISEKTITVKGPKGELTKTFSPKISFEENDGSITVTRASDDREDRSLHGLTRALVNNMVIGVTEGFTKSLELQGVGYRVQEERSGITLQVGFSHPVPVVPHDGITFRVEDNDQIHVDGIDKQVVGEVAARLRAIRPPNVYTGKGIRYLGEQVRRKAGKAGAGGGTE
ncbi:MAG: 50S ribosomal protein L6 [SAR202 cluster bacterium]|nr:50S ribosomal protein L6 [SAR202 cluster bacterium]